MARKIIGEGRKCITLHDNASPERIATVVKDGEAFEASKIFIDGPCTVYHDGEETLIETKAEVSVEDQTETLSFFVVHDGSKRWAMVSARNARQAKSIAPFAVKKCVRADVPDTYGSVPHVENEWRT